MWSKSASGCMKVRPRSSSVFRTGGNFPSRIRISSLLRATRKETDNLNPEKNSLPVKPPANQPQHHQHAHVFVHRPVNAAEDLLAEMRLESPDNPALDQV